MNIIFDIGNVLIAWDLHRAFDDAYPEAAEFDAFLQRTGFYALNLRADQGTAFADLARAVSEPTDAALIRSYPARFARSIAAPVPGSWQILRDLKARGHRIHAITNWSQETWPEALRLHPDLASTFECLVISGREGLLKPDPAIFRLFCARADVAPQDCLFIDDLPANTAGAKAAGMDALPFTGAADLRRELTLRGLL
ncbi:HAD family hydrolase [Falsigemmobacter faecalis]|uniref:HAD family phosphatase n=1 Tax=Falsigemmobacter faecalis TaxID=2488730 RepID=A0A3P3DQY0_9RHOB|nr:HAD family phosphatase [Falsigemmobacter faecalis]RRH76629.1 HAD family phosphatase [Falsigemmobacter faecalis]